MVHFVGAGSGAADLITVRGKQYLEEADVVIYAGSLVNPQILDYTKDVCTIYNSAKMTLEQVIEVIEQAETAGKTTVRLHTGDPCLYGAIREQMDTLDELGITYDICPGVSSFCGSSRFTDGVYSSGNIPKRNHYQNGRKNTGAGKREHPSVCFSSGNHGDLFKYRNVKRTVKAESNGRGIQPGYAGCYCIQGNLAGRENRVYGWNCGTSWQRQRSVNILQKQP